MPPAGPLFLSLCPRAIRIASECGIEVAAVGRVKGRSLTFILPPAGVIHAIRMPADEVIQLI
jgi:hypothetical protein